jgi:glycosyltransferase involved in cell wall biosynthesis
MRSVRLAYLVSHPIQYQAPLLRRVAAEPGINLKVFFASGFSTRGFMDCEFGRRIQWDVPLLDGYEREFLPALGSVEGASFWRPINYGLARRLREGRFDALWVHGYMRWQHWVAMAAARRLRIKVLVRDEANAISARRGPLRRVGKRGFFTCLNRIVDRFLAIGTLNREYYQHSGIAEEKTFTVPYAVDNRFFQSLVSDSSARRDELRRSLGLETGRPVILYAGKLTERKGPDALLDAYARLSHGCSGLRPYLLYAGDGELRDSIEAQAAEMGWGTIKFLGFRNQTELPALYDLCDLFVIPSKL